MSAMSRPALALFDLDGTLLPHDTQLLFCNWVLRRHALRRFFLPLVAAFAPAGITRVLEARELKRIFLSYLWLMPEDRVRAYARQFAEWVSARCLYPELEQEIARHRAEGRVLVLNSASPDFYVREIGRVLGFHHAIGTPVLLQPHQPLIADIEGDNNKREAKLPRMEQLGLLPCDTENTWAYSDSSADLPMLGLARHVVTINPGAHLTRVALDSQWSILRPERPWKTNLGQALVVGRQLLGAWPE